MYSTRLLLPPQVEPVSLEEMKAFARVTNSSDDALLSSLIVSARSWCENYTKRAFVQQTWRLAYIGNLVERYVVLPRPPLVSVESIVVIDEDAQATAVPLDIFVLDTQAEPGRLVLKIAASWADLTGLWSGIQIDYVTGYGLDGTAVPASLRLAIMQMALHWYENRETLTVGDQVGRLPLMAESLLADFKLRTMGVLCG